MPTHKVSSSKTHDNTTGGNSKANNKGGTDKPGTTTGSKKGDKPVSDKEGAGVDVGPGSTPPKAGTHERDVYDAKKQLVDDGKAAGMQAAQLLASTLAQIKEWAKSHDNDSDIG